MFHVALRKKIQQFFCRHNYFAVAVTENYQEIETMERKQVVFYECRHCTRLHSVKNEKYKSKN